MWQNSSKAVVLLAALLLLISAQKSFGNEESSSAAAAVRANDDLYGINGRLLDSSPKSSQSSTEKMRRLLLSDGTDNPTVSPTKDTANPTVSPTAFPTQYPTPKTCYPDVIPGKGCVDFSDACQGCTVEECFPYCNDNPKCIGVDYLNIGDSGNCDLCFSDRLSDLPSFTVYFQGPCQPTTQPTEEPTNSPTASPTKTSLSPTNSPSVSPTVKTSGPTSATEYPTQYPTPKICYDDVIPNHYCRNYRDGCQSCTLEECFPYCDANPNCIGVDFTGSANGVGNCDMCFGDAISASPSYTVYFQSTCQPTAVPSLSPTEKPSVSPTKLTGSPSLSPTANTDEPTEKPTDTPTVSPSESSSSPTDSPSMSPTALTNEPTSVTEYPTQHPTPKICYPDVIPQAKCSNASDACWFCPLEECFGHCNENPNCIGVDYIDWQNGVGNCDFCFTNSTIKEQTVYDVYFQGPCPPTAEPSLSPTESPSVSPTKLTGSPSLSPTASTDEPTEKPTDSPTQYPTAKICYPDVIPQEKCESFNDACQGCTLEECFLQCNDNPNCIGVDFLRFDNGVGNCDFCFTNSTIEGLILYTVYFQGPCQPTAVPSLSPTENPSVSPTKLTVSPSEPSLNPTDSPSVSPTVKTNGPTAVTEYPTQHPTPKICYDDVIHNHYCRNFLPGCYRCTMEECFLDCDANPNCIGVDFAEPDGVGICDMCFGDEISASPTYTVYFQSTCQPTAVPSLSPTSDTEYPTKYPSPKIETCFTTVLPNEACVNKEYDCPTCELEECFWYCGFHPECAGVEYNENTGGCSLCMNTSLTTDEDYTVYYPGPCETTVSPSSAPISISRAQSGDTKKDSSNSENNSSNNKNNNDNNGELIALIVCLVFVIMAAASAYGIWIYRRKQTAVARVTSSLKKSSEMNSYGTTLLD